MTSTALGPIFTVQTGANATIENLEITGATGVNPPGQGINCNVSAILKIKNSVIAQNADDGLLANQCGVTVSDTRFTGNQRGVAVTNGSGTFDRCEVDDNRAVGMSMTAGIYTVTNAFVFRNFGGITTDVATITSSTIVDNGGTTTPGVTCAATATVSNNIIARNAPQNLSASCVPTTSIVATDVSSLRFVSPDVPPFDYHITAGSSAIDQAGSGVDHDFDGEHRPKGAAPDLGADEAQ